MTVFKTWEHLNLSFKQIKTSKRVVNKVNNLLLFKIKNITNRLFNSFCYCLAFFFGIKSFKPEEYLTDTYYLKYSLGYFKVY